MPTLIEVYKKAIFELENPRKDEINIRILLCYINNLHTMTDFYLHENDEIKDHKKFLELYKKYLVGFPVQYLINSAYFYKRDYYVDDRVLIPRMETEEVVEFAINKIKEKHGKNPVNILDCCCGSGCIGVTIAKEISNSSVVFSDISKDAIDVAKMNAKYHKVDAEFLLGNALLPSVELNKKYHAIIANPPYIINRDDVDKSTANFEPQLALYANWDLLVYQRIMEYAKDVLLPGGFIVFEIGYDIVDRLRDIVGYYLPDSNYSFYKDINGKYRIMYIEVN